MKPGKGGIRLPDLTAEQKAAGLEKARRRRTLFRLVKEGAFDLGMVWERGTTEPTSEWAAVPVRAFLLGLRGVGEGKTSCWMREAHIHPKVRLGHLSNEQANCLAVLFEAALKRSSRVANRPGDETGSEASCARPIKEKGRHESTMNEPQGNESEDTITVFSSNSVTELTQFLLSLNQSEDDE